MKQDTISCDIIRDLLPLYEDDCCSKDSSILVEAHIRECESCRKEHALFQTPINTTHEEPDVAKIKAGIQKFKFGRTVGILALALGLILIFIVIPAINHTTGTSITYSNLNELHTANQFVKALSSGNYSEAYNYLDIEGKYHSLINTDYGPRTDADTIAVKSGIAQIETLGFHWYDQTARDTFLDNMNTLEEINSNPVTYSYQSAIRQTEDAWCFSYNATLENSLPIRLCIYVRDQKVYSYSINLQASEKIEELNLNRHMGEIADYLSIYYQMPSLNEAVCEILYDETSYDWRDLFTRDIDAETLFDLE